MKIRHSSQLVASLPPDLQKIARDSYEISLKAVFIFSACSTLLAFLVRAPVRSITPGDSAIEESGDEGPEPEQPPRTHRRRLSTYESADGVMDPERELGFRPASKRTEQK
ncbi:hypothetical protein C0991_012448 [Blastosporella zonata]|nr:hypothetical protein C0991_012448 [Blastosporella zonata]